MTATKPSHEARGGPISRAVTCVLTPHVLFVVAVLAAIATWLMLLIGGAVNPTGSSLACKDWAFGPGLVPQCNGESFPEMSGGVLYEHGHRLWGWLVGVFTTVVVVGSLATPGLPKQTKWLAIGALLLVVLQGALGGITVLLGLSAAISTAHLVVGYSCLALMVFLAWRLVPARRREPTVGSTLPRGEILVAAALVLAQIILGGLLRHLGANYVCGNDLLSCNEEGLFPADGLQLMHMLHRAVGYAAMVVVVWAVLRVRRTARANDRGRMTQLAWFAVGLTAAQVALGMVTVVMGSILPIVMFHTAIAGLLLTVLVALYIGFGPLGARLASPAGLRA